ncbi:Dabb family protein, partial [Streptomyces violaceoruber]
MIRHLVLFKLNDGVGRDEPRVLAGVEAFRALGGQ